MWRQPIVLLLALLPMACIVKTESVEGETGPQGEQGDPGETGTPGEQGMAGVSPFSYVDQSTTDIFYSGGRVGIGTASPVGTLDVAGAATFTQLPGRATIGSAGLEYPSFGYNLVYGNSSGSYTYRFDDGATLLRLGNGFAPTAAALEFSSAAPGTAGESISLTALMTLLHNGSLGIGTNSIPQWAQGYHVSHIGQYTTLADLVDLATGHTTLGNNYYESDMGHRHIKSGRASYYRQYDGTHQFIVTDSDPGPGGIMERNFAMTITSTGKVGIATIAPDSTLAVGQSADGDNNNYSISLARHGTTNSPGTYAPGSPALSVRDYSSEGPPTLDQTALVSIYTPRIGDNDPGAANALLLDVGNDNFSALTVNAARHVGIGTRVPMATLDINGTARLAKYSSPPFSCDPQRDGTIALTSKYVTCVCNGAAWVRTSDGNTVCTVWQ